MQITVTPTPKQHLCYQKLFDKGTKYVVFGGGAGGGKSFLGCEWVLLNVLQYPGTKWFIGRKELKRLMQSTFVTWQKVCKHHGVDPKTWKLNGQYNYIEFENGSRIDLIDLDYQPSDPLFERFGSLEFTGGFIDEGGEIDFLAFDVLKSRVGRFMNREYELASKILITCNPNKEWIYREIYRPWVDGSLPSNYAFIQSLYKDNPYTADEYEDNLSQIRDTVTRERLKNGNWEYDQANNVLLNYDAINDLFVNHVPPGRFYITADVARYGQDKTVIGVWDGLKLVRVEYLTKSGIPEVANAIRDLANQYQIPFSQIVVDEDGVGGGVVDLLRGVRGFVANSSPVKVNGKTENYQNLKTQCSFKLADLVNEHKIAARITDQKAKAWIIEELDQIRSKEIDKDGKRKVVSKDEVKKNIGRSPDFGDNFIMRMIFELSGSWSSDMNTERQYKPNFKAKFAKIIQ